MWAPGPQLFPTSLGKCQCGFDSDMLRREALELTGKTHYDNIGPTTILVALETLIFLSVPLFNVQKSHQQRTGQLPHLLNERSIYHSVYRLLIL